MCYDTQSSVLGFLAAAVASGILLLRRQPQDTWLAAFSLTFACIQLIEAGIWHNMADSKERKAWSSLLPTALFMQPLVQCLGCSAVTGSSLALTLTVLTCANFLYKGSVDSRKGPNNHLIWLFTPDIPQWSWALYLAGLFVPLVFVQPPQFAATLVLFGVASAVSSMKSAPEFSSLWCHRALVFPVLACLNPF